MNDCKESDIWLTAAEIARLKLKTLPNSKTTVLRRAKENNWDRKKRKGAGGGFCFSFLTLPIETQQEIKNNQTKWQQVCEFSKNRRFHSSKEEMSKTLPSNRQEEFQLSPADKDFTKATARRFVFEEIYSGINREGLNGLSSKLGISVEELEKYEHGEKPLNIVHIKKLSELGFDVLYIIFGIRTKNDNRPIHNEFNNNILSNINYTQKLN